MAVSDTTTRSPINITLLVYCVMQIPHICLQVTIIAYSQQPPDVLHISAPANKATYNQHEKKKQALETLLQEHFAPATEEGSKFLNSCNIIVLRLQNQPLILLCRWNLNCTIPCTMMFIRGTIDTIRAGKPPLYKYSQGSVLVRRMT